jgi:hypothetical protein
MLAMWNAELTYQVTPKSGPMRSMRTLRDVNRAFLDDLTPQYRHRRHWFAVGRLLMAAASSKARLDLMLATDALVMALEVEGWMTRRPLKAKATISEIREIRPARASCEADQPAALAA